MSKSQTFVDTVDQIVSYGVRKEIGHLYTDNGKKINCNSISLKGREVVNFGSCSYLGLEFDSRIKSAGKEAIDNFGTQFSESRAYVSISLYSELEKLLEKIFNGYVVITQSTTLGHMATIPVLICHNTDCIIMDHQVHNSIQMAVSMVKGQGIHVELLRHNRIDLLEERIQLLRGKYKRIWYMADGIYSMYGDKSPVKEIYHLMDKYPELYYYADDAHGMSIYGEHGRGYVLSQAPIHPKAIVATSLNKAYATGGAAIVFPSKEWAQKVRKCGGPLITSGPMQPSQLGAAVASAKIHLSDEIYEMQAGLQDNIRFANLMLKKYRLPVVSPSDAAVFFIAAGLPKLGYNMVKRMLNKGYYVNLGIFPAVPMKNTGIRFTITRLHTFTQIENMIATLAAELPQALAEENIRLADIYKAFKMPLPEDAMIDSAVKSVVSQSLSLWLTHYSTVEQVPKEEWNSLFAGKGSFDWDNLSVLEKSFSNNKMPQDNWQFDYIVVRDHAGRPVLATFLTTAIWKDDMLSPGSVSARIETMRLTDPYYLTSKVICTGSLITEGEHIFIDKHSNLWKDAMQLFFDKIYALQEQYKCNSIVLRDFSVADEEMDTYFVDNGFFRISLPENNIVDNSSWKGKDGHYGSLSKRSQQHFREDIRKHENKFSVKIETDYSEENLDSWYALYLNVKNNNLALNTFTLPKKFFRNILSTGNWEVLSLTVKPEFDFIGLAKPVAVVFCCKTTRTYLPVIMGLDYRFNQTYKTYKQALYQLVMRGAELGCSRTNLGFSASMEKRKVGAVPRAVYGFMQSKDNYNLQVLANMAMSTSK